MKINQIHLEYLDGDEVKSVYLQLSDTRCTELIAALPRYKPPYKKEDFEEALRKIS